jgi:hypothetical protein
MVIPRTYNRHFKFFFSIDIKLLIFIEYIYIGIDSCCRFMPFLPEFLNIVTRKDCIFSFILHGKGKAISATGREGL